MQFKKGFYDKCIGLPGTVIPFHTLPSTLMWCFTPQIAIRAHSLGCELVPVHMLLPVRGEMGAEKVRAYKLQ